MNFIVVGCGRVGRHLANYLLGKGHDVTIVDKNPNAFRKIERHPNLSTIVGAGIDQSILKSANIETADGLAAVTSGDNSNVVIARIAKEIFKVPKVIARIYDPARADLYQRLGISTVASVTWATDQFIKKFDLDEVSLDWIDPTGEIVVIERQLPKTWARKSLAPLSVEGKASIVATTHLGKSFVISPNSKGHEDDSIFVACNKDFIKEFDDLLSNGVQE